MELHDIPIRGVRVEDDKVIITIKGGNKVAREVCGVLVKLVDPRPYFTQPKPYPKIRG